MRILTLIFCSNFWRHATDTAHYAPHVLVCNAITDTMDHTFYHILSRRSCIPWVAHEYGNHTG